MARPRCTSPCWEMLKGFVLASAVAQDEPIRTGPRQNYGARRAVSWLGWRWAYLGKDSLSLFFPKVVLINGVKQALTRLEQNEIFRNRSYGFNLCITLFS